MKINYPLLFSSQCNQSYNLKENFHFNKKDNIQHIKALMAEVFSI